MSRNANKTSTIRDKAQEIIYYEGTSSISLPNPSSGTLTIDMHLRSPPLSVLVLGRMLPGPLLVVAIQ